MRNGSPCNSVAFTVAGAKVVNIFENRAEIQRKMRLANENSFFL